MAVSPGTTTGTLGQFCGRPCSSSQGCSPDGVVTVRKSRWGSVWHLGSKSRQRYVAPGIVTDLVDSLQK